MKLLLSLLFTLMTLPQIASSEEVRIHLGHTADPHEDPTSEAGVRWNRIRTWGVVSNDRLLTTDNAPSAMTWETTQRFSFHFNTGIGQSEMGYPGIVSRHGYYLARKEKIGEEGPFHQAEVVLGQLDSGQEYKITFYGARMAGFQGDVSLHITAKGHSEEQVSLHLPSGGATEQEETIGRLRPDSHGSITLKFEVLEGYNRGVINSISIESLP